MLSTPEKKGETEREMQLNGKKGQWMSRIVRRGNAQQGNKRISKFPHAVFTKHTRLTIPILRALLQFYTRANFFSGSKTCHQLAE